MARIRLALAACAAALLSTACYKVTVVTGAAPGATVVDQPWTHFFVFGLVPPPNGPVNVAQRCPGGNVSQVVTQQSFVNGLVSSLTFSLYTPQQVTVTCAASRSGALGTTGAQLGALSPATAVPAAGPAEVPAAPAGH